MKGYNLKDFKHGDRVIIQVHGRNNRILQEHYHTLFTDADGDLAFYSVAVHKLSEVSKTNAIILNKN